ncbi:hypothetical protein J7L00_03515 [Candidatus Bathyarchaeota archaeon]|nr:hypothetical protein [Candidatus Bathyarchaeota archaeon]
MSIMHKFGIALKWLILILYTLLLYMLLPFEILCLRLANRNPRVAAKVAKLKTFFFALVFLGILLNFSIGYEGYRGDEKWVRMFRMTIGREKVSSH